MKNNKKKSLRLTRRSYRRKFVMFGVSVFMSLALTATGFAAWVLSKDAKKDASGAVEVGAVTEANITISDIAFTKLDKDEQPLKNFVFEPLEDDTNGLVRYDVVNKPAPENLDIKLKWSVENYQSVGKHFVEFKIPASVKAAMDAGYIALPKTASGDDIFEIADEAVTVSSDNGDVSYYIAKYDIAPVTENGEDANKVVKYEVTKQGDVVTATFEMTLKFVWGEKFGGMNPCKYFDTDNCPDKAGKDDETYYEFVKDTLNTFKTTVHGIEYNEDFEKLTAEEKAEQYNNKPIPNYIVTVNATVA